MAPVGGQRDFLPLPIPRSRLFSDDTSIYRQDCTAVGSLAMVAIRERIESVEIEPGLSPAAVETAGSADLEPSRRAWRWGAIDDPPPAKPPTRFRCLFSWLILFNEY